MLIKLQLASPVLIKTLHSGLQGAVNISNTHMYSAMQIGGIIFRIILFAQLWEIHQLSLL